MSAKVAGKISKNGRRLAVIRLGLDARHITEVAMRLEKSGRRQIIQRFLNYPRIGFFCGIAGFWLLNPYSLKYWSVLIKLVKTSRNPDFYPDN